MEDNGFIYFDGIGMGKGGLCDRLKGMYSCYALSKKLNKKFYYSLPYPVALKALHFEQPKTHDFEEMYIIDWDAYISNQDKIKKLDFNIKNYKIHTNIDFTNDLDTNISFSEFINHFFDLKLFEQDHNVYGYDIGIHIRCGGAMVPWSDYDFGVKFNEQEFKQKLNDICLDNRKDVFLCSDSQKVSYIADTMNFRNLSTSPHVPKHIDRSSDMTESDLIGVFYDLLTLAKCKLIYHTQGEFAKTAAKIYNNELRTF